MAKHESVGNSGTHIAWMSDETAANMGLHTEEQKQAYLEDQKRQEEQRAKDWLAEKVAIAKGKDISRIPDGDFCHFFWMTDDESAKLRAIEAQFPNDSSRYVHLLIEYTKVYLCPYHHRTGYGTVQCRFLDEEVVDTHKGDYEKALAHFGSEDEVDRVCTGSEWFAGGLRCCRGVLGELRRNGITAVFEGPETTDPEEPRSPAD